MMMIANFVVAKLEAAMIVVAIDSNPIGPIDPIDSIPNPKLIPIDPIGPIDSIPMMDNLPIPNLMLPNPNIEAMNPMMVVVETMKTNQPDAIDSMMNPKRTNLTATNLDAIHLLNATIPMSIHLIYTNHQHAIHLMMANSKLTIELLGAIHLVELLLVSIVNLMKESNRLMVRTKVVTSWQQQQH